MSELAQILVKMYKATTIFKPLGLHWGNTIFMPGFITHSELQPRPLPPRN